MVKHEQETRECVFIVAREHMSTVYMELLTHMLYSI